MARPRDKRDETETQAGEFQQSSELRIAELLDELYALEQFRREQLVLRRLGAYLKSALRREEIHTAAERFGPLLWPQAAGELYSLHPVTEQFERVALWGDPSLTELSFSPRDCWAVRRARPHYVEDGGVELRCAHAVGALPSLCVPLSAQGRTFGVLRLQGIAGKQKSADTNAENPAVALAIAAGEELSFALANLRLQEVLREQAVRDPLTGLFNRQFFEELLIREMARAERKTHQISVLVLDIDHFKRINDTFGHSAGDTVLRHIGPVLQAHVRGSDVACRIGGEEFLLLLSELALPGAVQRAEAIRKALRQISLKFGDNVLTPITASFGAAAYPDHGRTVEAVFRAADQALLDAKREGRDRVVAARLP